MFLIRDCEEKHPTSSKEKQGKKNLKHKFLIPKLAIVKVRNHDNFRQFYNSTFIELNQKNRVIDKFIISNL